MPEAGYTSKRNPVVLVCEVCGYKKDCIPCGNHRWCKRGRCPLCLPSVLTLSDKHGEEFQKQVHKKIWDMEFWCEVCANSKSRRPPLLRDLLEHETSKQAAPLDGCPGFYMSTDGTVLSAQEYAASQQPKSAQARLKQQLQRPPQAPQQQPPQQQARRPPQEPTQERPKPKQQTPSRPTGRSPSPADSAAAKAKKPTEDGEPPKKRLKQTAAAKAETAKAGGPGKPPGQAERPKAAAAAAAAAASGGSGSSSESSSEDNASSSDDEEPGDAPPRNRAAAAAAVGKPAAAGKAAAPQPGGPGVQRAAGPGSRPAASPPGMAAAAAARLKAGPRSSQQQRGTPGSSRSQGSHSAGAPAAGGQARPSSSGAAAAAAAAAAIRKRRTPERSSSSGDLPDTNLSLTQLHSKHKAAAAGDGSSMPKRAEAGQQPGLKRAPNAALQGKPSAGGKPKAGAGSAAVPQQQQQQQQQQVKPKPAPQQQQQQPRPASKPAERSQQDNAAPAAAAAARTQPPAQPVQQTEGSVQAPQKPRRQQQPSQQPAPALKPAAAAAPGSGVRNQQEQATGSKRAAAGGAAPPAAADGAAGKPAAAAAGRKPEQLLRSKQQMAQPARAAAAAGAPGDSEGGSSSGEEESSADEEGGSTEGSLSIDMAGPPAGDSGRGQRQGQPPQQHNRDKEDRHPKDVQQNHAGKAPAGNAAAPAVKPVATKAAPKAPPPAAAAAVKEPEAASGLGAASPRVRKATTPRQNAFNPMSLDIMRDPLTSQAAEEQPGVAADAAGGAAQSAAAAGHRPSATAAALAFRARQTGGQTTTRLWPIKCRVEAAGPTFRYEFAARVNPSQHRSNVQVPPLLEKLRDGTLRCMFWNKETMLDCVQADAHGVEHEVLFSEPAPMALIEFAFHQSHNPRLPAVIKFMVEHRCYLRVWSDSGSLFFGPVLKRNGNVADYDDPELACAPREQQRERLAELLKANELGLVMFKDAREPAAPDVYGKLIGADTAAVDDAVGQGHGEIDCVNQMTPTGRAAMAAATLHDESFLWDTDLNEFYDDVIYHNWEVAQGPSLPAVRAGSQRGQRQQLQLSAGMDRDTLAARPSKRARVPGSARTVQAAGGQGVDAAPAGADPTAVTPTDLQGSGSDGQDMQEGEEQLQHHEDDHHHQQQQQDVDMEDIPNSQLHPQAAATAAAANGVQQEAQQQQQQAQQEPGLHQQQQQQQGDVVQVDDGWSPLEQLLDGGVPTGQLLPRPDHLVQLMSTQGLSGLVIYLDPLSFEKYGTADDFTTPELVARARRHGVTIFTPQDPPPPPSSVNVLLATNAHMGKCALETLSSHVRTTDFLVSGAMVLSENFLLHLVDLPQELGPLKAALKHAPANSPAAGLLHDVHAAYFQTGVALLLDVTLLLMTRYDEVRSMLLQLHALKELLPGRAQVLAFVLQSHLDEAAQQHLGSAHQSSEYLHHLTSGQELCQVMDRRYVSSKAEPRGTHSLRNAHKVAFNYNKRAHIQMDHILPLRFTVVVTADNASQLPVERQRAVADLLNNSDGMHQTVIGATLRQTRHLLSAMTQQLQHEQQG